MSEDALYHPWIDPTNGASVRTAILYFDHMWTIVPESVERPYQNQHTRAASELGFLRPRIVHSNDECVVQVSEEFRRDWNRPSIVRSVEAAEKKSRVMDDSWARLSGEKVSMAFRHRVFEQVPPDHDGFYRVAAGFGNAYMSRMAAVIASNDGLTACTDYGIGHDVLVDRYAALDNEEHPVDRAEAVLARLSIDALATPDSVSLGRLWSFRETHYDELLRYRKAIRKLARTLAGLRRIDHLIGEARRVVQDEIEPACSDLQARFTDRNIEFSRGIVEGVASGIVAAPKGVVAAITTAAIKIAYSGLRLVLGDRRLKREPFAYRLQAHRTQR